MGIRDYVAGAFEGIADSASDFFDIAKAVFLPIAFFGAVAGGALYLVSSSVSNREDLERKMEMKADTNGDGVITREEIINVYKSLGLRYNEVNPRSLSSNDIGRYLESSSLEAEKR